jgi:hypothetical protein
VAEVFVELPAPVGRIEPVRSIRSTLISSSLMAVKKRDLTDAYFRLLPEEHHEAIQGLVAGVWVEMPLARAHYAAIDALGLSSDEQVSMGRDVADRIQRSVLATLARMATGAGVTPWTGLAIMPKLWDRLFIGGACGITKIAQKDARVEVVKLSLCEMSYFRHAFAGVLSAGSELFCRNAFVTQLPRRGEVWSFKLSWA